MQIVLNNIGKRFNREWIFRHLDYTLQDGKSYAITGSNGSGKSTLLQVIAGSLSFNEGTIAYNQNAKAIAGEEIYRHLSIATPYLELVEEMTALEMLRFHQQFVPLQLSLDEILQKASLQKAANKQIRYFSSGMKQRLKLSLAFFSKTTLLLLDEPTTNLDEEGIALYHHLADNYRKDRLVLVSSNDKQEYNFCDEVIEIGKYK